jgi:hypothetical protein
MRIRLISPHELRLSEFGNAAFDVRPEGPGTHFGAREMFVTSIGLCTYAMLAEMHGTRGADPWNLDLRIGWQYLDHPLRIGHIEMAISWPDLPDDMHQTALDQVQHCLLLNSLERETRVTTRILPVDGKEDDAASSAPPR